jgi:beta-lactamase regulating signal transducer with metallopeptidase domain
MFDLIADMPLVELFLKFMIASTVMMGAVWLAEKFGLIRTPDLAELAWKLAIAGSFVALLPVGDWLSGPITIEHTRAAQLVQQIEDGRPLSNVAQRDFTPRALPDNDIPMNGKPVTRDQQSEPGQPAIITMTMTSEDLVRSATPPKAKPVQQTITHEVTGTEPMMPEADSEDITSTGFLEGVADLSTKQLTAMLWGLLALMTTGALAWAYRLAVKDLGSRTRVDAEHEANKTLREICTQIDTRHVPYLSRSSDIKSPICLPRREICLPDWAFDDLPKAELKSLLAHEMGHMVRRDPLMLMALQMLSRLFFFQPMFIVARRRLTDIAELAADEWAAKQLSDARAVATALFTCATKIQENRQIQWGLAMAGNKSMLKTRVERLIGAERLPFKNAGVAAKGTLTAGMVVLALGLPSIQFAEALNAEHDIAGHDIKDERAHERAEASRLRAEERRAAAHARAEAKAEARAEAKAHAVAAAMARTEARVEAKARAESRQEIGVAMRDMGLSGEKGTYEINGSDFTFVSTDGSKHARRDGDHRSVSITHDDDGRISGNMVWVNDDRVVKAEWDGKFELSDDERTVKSLTRGGELELQTKGDGPRRRAVFEDAKGGIEVTYWVDGDKQALDRDGEEWVANTLRTLIRETGLNADKRVARILKKDGVDGVLDEMDTIESDYVTRLYSGHLIEQANLKDKEINRLIDRLSKLDSDYEMRLALTALLMEEKVSDKAMPKVLDAAGQIDSDYELRLLLTPYLDKFGVNKKTMKTLIALADKMDSDYEIRLLLSPSFEKVDLDDNMMSDLLEIAERIDSDYELRLLLSQAVYGKKLSTKNIEKLARIASEQIDSDYEARLFMGAFIEQIKQSSDATDILISKVSHIDSDYERRLAIAMLGSYGKMSEKSWLMLLDAVRGIDSDYEKAQSLMEVGTMLPEGNKKIDDAYRSVVESIDSDYERGRIAAVSRVSPPIAPRSEVKPAKAVEPTGI